MKPFALESSSKPRPTQIAEFKRRFKEVFLRDITEEECRFFRLSDPVSEETQELEIRVKPAA